jgi:hypothetical protein
MRLFLDKIVRRASFCFRGICFWSKKPSVIRFRGFPLFLSNVSAAAFCFQCFCGKLFKFFYDRTSNQEAKISQFGFGIISSFRATNITSRIPKYKDVKLVETDLNENIFYSGRYTGYGDDELREVIDTNLFLPDEHNRENFLSIHQNREDLLSAGKLLHFRAIDSNLDLPPGTAKRLLNSVAERYKLVPKIEMENIIRYKCKNHT